MFGLGLPELVIVLVVVFFLFGAKRIPELASGLGEGIRSFKKAMHEDPAPKGEKVAIEETSKSK
jgi:sec-independent protein translocase protein TatA